MRILKQNLIVMPY